MATELSFLLDILLNHKLTKTTKDAISQRIKDVECAITAPRPPHQQTFYVGSSSSQAPPTVQHGALQSASTAALLQKHSDLIGTTAINIAPKDPSVLPSNPPAQVELANIAQTPAAAQALAERQAKINAAMSGSPEKGRASPRKM